MSKMMSFECSLGKVCYELKDHCIQSALARVPKQGRLLTNPELDGLLRSDPTYAIYNLTGFKAITNLFVAFEAENMPLKDVIRVTEFQSANPQPLRLFCTVPQEYRGKKNLGLVFESCQSQWDWERGELKGVPIGAFPVPTGTGVWVECDEKFGLPNGKSHSRFDPKARCFYRSGKAFIGAVGRSLGWNVDWVSPFSVIGAAWVEPIDKNSRTG